MIEVRMIIEAQYKKHNPMKNTILLFSLILLSIQFSFAQSESNSDIKIDTLTIEENLQWLEDFKKLESKTEKIQAIKDKIVFDSAYQNYFPIRQGCGLVRMIVDTTKNNIDKDIHISSSVLKSESKLLFVISASRSGYFLLDK